MRLNLCASILFLLPLAGCGLAETAATGATAGAAAAEEARQGLKTEQNVKDRVEAAQQLETQHRHAAESASTQ